jgi:hypothetical protein
MRYHVAAIKGTEYRGDLYHTLRPGNLLILRRESSNRYDSNAVAVDATAPSWHGQQKHIGYVSKGLAQYLGPALDAGERIAAIYIGEQFGPQMLILRGIQSSELEQGFN